MSTKLKSMKDLKNITSKKYVCGSSASSSPSQLPLVENNKVRNLYLVLRKKRNSKFENTSNSISKQLKTNQAIATARSLQNSEATSKSRKLRRVNSKYSDSKKVITKIPTSTTTSVNTNDTSATTVRLTEALAVPEISKSPDIEDTTVILLTEATPPPPPITTTTSSKETLVEDSSKASKNRVNSAQPKCCKPESIKQVSTSAKSALNGNQWKSPFKSFLSTGVRMSNNCNPKLDCGHFAYHLSRDELKYLGAYKSPMKQATASERQLLQSGQRMKYLNQRYKYSPCRKYNYPEATSWRIGWLHNSHGHGENRNSSIFPCS